LAAREGFLEWSSRPAADADELAGRRIGPYAVKRRLASGGMGSVYLAARIDDYRQEVALELIKRGLDSDEVVRRFRHERQVLAGLNHPHIARLLDGGTAEGQPYLVMEYVAGEPIDRYCARHRLGLRERLRLFVAVCAAVHHAHQRTVIHRDLKPANILVDEAGQPRVLDFGIARVTAPEADTAGPATQPGLLVGTPAYMSPEQAAGDPDGLDTRSDVYSLGVVCYELLAGRLPYDVHGKPIAEAVRVITTVEPPSLGALNRACRGDLERVVAKALEKDRARRYPSASELAADVERFLRGEPVLARRVGTLGQLYRWGRRNPTVAGLVAALLLVLLGGLAGTTYLWRLAEARGEDARRKQALADAHYELAWKFVDDYYFRASGRGVRTDGAEAPSPQELLEGAVAHFRELAARQDDPKVRHQLAWAYTRLGELHWKAGRKEDGRAAFREALALREKLAEELGGDYSVALAGVLEVLANRQDDPAESRHLHLRALQLREQSAAEKPDDLGQQGQLAFSSHNLGALDGKAGRFEKALEWYEKARERWHQCMAAYPGEVRYRPQLALTLKDMGWARLSLGLADAEKGRKEDATRAYREVERLWQRSCELREEAARSQPADLKNLTEVAELLPELAVVHAELGQPYAALAAHQQACAVREQILEKSTPPAVWQAMDKLAAAYEALASEQEASQPADAARSRQKAHAFKNHPRPSAARP
jgi:tetratricopeptide (TPR) repeat protein